MANSRRSAHLVGAEAMCRAGGFRTFGGQRFVDLDGALELEATVHPAALCSWRMEAEPACREIDFADLRHPARVRAP